MSNRPKIPPPIIDSVLMKSRRRCCLCVFLDRDDTIKRGQIAHVNHEREDNAEENLVFLCLRHHDEYDSKTSVSKNFTQSEVKQYRELLYERLRPTPPPVLWTVTIPRNPFFTGREKYLNDLHAALTESGKAAITQSISGLGGIGKTQTAAEYAYRHRDHYCAVFWVTAANETTLSTGYSEIARGLNLREKDEQDQQVIANAVKRWLEGNEGWLLILDNADTPNTVIPYLPNDHKGRILVTSRAHSLQCLGIVNPLELQEMPPDEALSFLLRRTGREVADSDETESATALAEELGYLPLALEQAAAYIAAQDCSFADYLKGYAKRRLDLLEKQGPLMGQYPHSVVTTWSENFTEVEAISPAAADVLRLSAMLAPEQIPYEALIEGASEAGPNIAGALANIADDPLAISELLEPLTRYSLIRREPEGWSVHRLVQAVIESGMTGAERRTCAERAVNAMNAATPAPEFSNWPLCERLLPHLLTCAGHVDGFGIETEEASRMLNQTAFYLKCRAQYVEAEPLYRRSLEICERVLGPDHPDTANSLNNLASLLNNQGKYDEAEPLFTRALEICERVLGPDHPATANSLNNLALLLNNQGKYDEAEPLYRRALEIKERVLGPDHPSTATSLNNLAGLFYAQGKYDEAEPLYARALEIRERVLGPDHPATATSLNNLAELLRKQGKYDEAEPLYARALEIRERVLGLDHPDTAQSLNNLALLLYSQGKYHEAEPLYTRALEIRERVLGPDHPDTATSLNNLAALLKNQGKYHEAEPLCRRALAICEKALGPEHPSTKTIRENLQGFLKTMGREE